MDFNAAMGSGANHNGNSNGKPPSGIDAFDAAEPAPEFTPVPPGIYNASVIKGEYCTTRKGDDAYRVRFVVSEGPQAGRTLLRIWTMGERAIRYSKRDLAELRLTTAAQLLSPFPPAGKEYHVRLVVALQRGEDGVERNDIKDVKVVRIVESPATAFMLPAESEGEQP